MGIRRPTLHIRIRKWLKLCLNYRYDYRRFLSYSGATRVDGDQHVKSTLQALITMDYHRIEKGLALSNPRPGFGADVLIRLFRDIRLHLKKYGHDHLLDIAANCIQKYCDFHNAIEFDVASVVERLRRLKEELTEHAPPLCGTKTASRESVLASIPSDVEQFFYSRSSVRSFTDEAVDKDLIENAVRIAQTSPSVCNRQSWKVYVGCDAKTNEEILKLQNGNRGFRDEVKSVMVVTSDLRKFVSVGERNQAWIDGGMFSMSLVYGLHSQGLGSCCLNWSVEKEQDIALKRLLNIPDNEVIIMLIAAGHLRDSYEVACSPRNDLAEVAQFIEPENS